MSVRVIALSLILVCVLAPATSAKEKPKPWDSVRVVGDADLVEDCELLGEVKGKSSWGGVMQSHAESKAYQHLKKNAQKMGANTVLMLTGHSVWAGSKYRGEAYNCEISGSSEVGMTVLGGILLCEEDQPSLDYLSVNPESGKSTPNGEVRYGFEVPIELGLGDFEPTRGTLESTGGLVSNVSTSWTGLTESEQQQLWKTLDASFSETKGEPDVHDTMKYSKAWHEVGGKKITLIEWDTDSGEIRISATCNDPVALENMKNVAAENEVAAAF